MRIVSAIPGLRRARAAERRPIELVPTLGALHQGHLSLLERAGAGDGALWMTLFVNPLQFGASEDLATYPRPLERDLELADQAGVELVFTPTVGDLYPPAFASYVEPTGAATRWEGESRPGHFRGVATVVAILFRLCQPRRAYFGEKDYQQLQVIRRLVRDLYLDVEIVACPTIRESDGLAYSSRNAYLAGPGPPERDRALSGPAGGATRLPGRGAARRPPGGTHDRDGRRGAGRRAGLCRGGGSG